MIKRPTIGVIGASKEEDDNKRIRYCERCESLHVKAILKPRVLMVDEVKPPDFDHWLQCQNCGTVYPKTETKIEPEISTIKEPSDGKQGRIRAVEGKRRKNKRMSEGRTSRLKSRTRSRWEITDDDLQRELSSGSVLLQYTSDEPIM